MRSLRPSLLAAAAVALLAAACGGQPTAVITLDASPSTVNIAPTAFSLLTVKGTFDGRDLQEGAQIVFDVTDGALFEGDQNETTVEVAGGKATVKLMSPTKPAKVTVTAKYIDPYAHTVTASKDVTFKTKTQVTKLNFSCGLVRNIAALYEGVGTIKVKCQAAAEDENNERVEGARVKFLAEAGEFEPTDDPEVFLYNPRSGNRLPKDVAPFGDETTGEPRWVDPRNHQTRNPRDGLVTLVAYVEGDSASASLFSTPYVDANDNDKFDAGEDMAAGETEYQAEQDKYLWKQIKIVWTGRTGPDNTVVKVETNDSGPLARGASRTFTWTVLDSNLNPMSAIAESDSINWSTPDYGILSIEAAALEHAYGIDLDDKFRVRNPTKRESYERFTTYQTTILNNRTDDDGAQLVRIPASVTFSIATDEDGNSSDTAENALPAPSLTLQ